MERLAGLCATGVPKEVSRNMGTRRDNGAGTDERRGENYSSRVMVNGRRYRITADTKRELERNKRDLLANADKGILPPSGKYTVDAWMTHFLQIVKDTREPATYNSYEQLYRLYLRQSVARIPLRDLQAGHLEAVFGEMRRTGKSPNTIARTKAVIRKALNVALERGELYRNVATLVAVPAAKRNSRAQPLAIQQAKALIAAAAGTQYEALLSVAVYCGLRESEILGLTHDCVDYKNGVMTVKQQLGFIEAGTSKRAIVAKLKSDASHRRFPIPDHCLQVLRAHKMRQAEQQLAASEWEDLHLVFCTRNGRPLGPRNMVRAFKRYLRKSGGPDVPFHMLRHGTATYLAAAGVPIRTAMEILGHSQMTTLVHVYQSATSEMKQAAAERLSAMFT